MSALTDRIRDVELGLKELGLLGGIRAVAQLVPLARSVLFAVSQRMAVVGLVVLATFGLVLGRARVGHRRATANVASERERLLEAAVECVRHADLWVTFGAERKARASVRRLGEALGRGAAVVEARASALSSANEVLAAGALVLALAASRAGWLGAAEDQGALLGFAVAFFMTYRPLRDLADARLAWAQGRDAYDELERAVAPAGDVASGVVQEDATSISILPTWPLAALELRDLRLARGSRVKLSVRIEPGTVVAVCGATGVGKTTFLRTLLGLERPLEGDVIFNGASLVDAAAGPASRPFAWVPQDAPLLADTLVANVSLGVPDAPGAPPTGVEAVSREALRSIGAGHMDATLGAERLGGGGRSVSGGERQWIALARAVATRQPVLLLDEPTSGMDAEAQRRVLDAIEHQKGRRTVVSVTHRPEPLAVAESNERLGAPEALEQAA